MLFLYDEEKIKTRFMLCTTRLPMHYLSMYVSSKYLSEFGWMLQHDLSINAQMKQLKQTTQQKQN